MPGSMPWKSSGGPSGRGSLHNDVLLILYTMSQSHKPYPQSKIISMIVFQLYPSTATSDSSANSERSASARCQMPAASFDLQPVASDHIHARTHLIVILKGRSYFSLIALP